MTVHNVSPAAPAVVWKALARRLSQPGRDRVKVFDPDTKEYRKTRRITDTLPTLMAAVYLYTHRRTTLLALDFDSKPHGQAQVDADFARALGWLTSCGARVVTDRSTNGGRHILVPLAIGTTASFDEIQSLMRQLKARLPSFDPKPMQNPKEGCISVPGTPCAGGGHRILDGTLTDAVAALTERSAPTLLPELYALLGTLPTPPQPANAAGLPSPGVTRTHAGEDERLAEPARWNKPLPAGVAEFAAIGDAALARDHGRWDSPSEARMSVVLNAVLRGSSLADIRAQAEPGRPWSGLGDSYRTKHGIRADAQLARDVRRALDYTATLAVKANLPAHRLKNSHGGHTSTGPHGRWLAHALAWADREFAGSPFRWTVRDVLQALAIKAVLAGELRSGTPIVGVGGRGLSLSAGLMPATTTFEVLRRIRDMVGAPILLVRPRVGRDADFYALTTETPDSITPIPLERVSVSDVHPAWSILGRHHRAVYELITQTGMTRTADVYAAARISARTGQLSIAALAAAGLITREGRTVMPGPTTLDAIAAAHRLDEVQADRIERYRRERAAWHAWLAHQDALKAITPEAADRVHASPHGHPVLAYEDDYLAHVMAHGPPPADDEYIAITLVTELMGARIVTETVPAVV
ncbi:hypothetical protein H7J93_00135 [Mycobacterium barrassiae]|uniref:hypothetical protein n=1 Tax=Mycobacterium barrassiae TaxID=319709 RepID=UPI002265A540|nr:hypothetical protein [Mycobacterium barrassiae]MCV7298046.1 hypothetical protein [Mycobacterium barrassiae]